MKTHSPEFTVCKMSGFLFLFLLLSSLMLQKKHKKEDHCWSPTGWYQPLLVKLQPCLCCLFVDMCDCDGGECAVCVSMVCSCFHGSQCNHSSNLSARILCVGDIKVLISTVTQHQCHCEDTSNTSTPPKSTEPTVCICACMCVCVREGDFKGLS